MTPSECNELQTTLAELANHLGPEQLTDPLRVLVYRAQSLFAAAPGAARAQESRAGRTARSSSPAFLAANGDLAVELLLTRMAEANGPTLGWLPSDRLTGLERLRRGEVIAAGFHGSDVPREIDGQRLVFIELVERQIGLAMRAGVRPRNLRQLRRWRMVSRPETAGVRTHLDDELRRAGIDSLALHDGAQLLSSHCEVVCAVARGDADLGIASRAWAHRVGLGFLPLGRETYGILVGAARLKDPRIVRLREVAESSAFRAEVGRIAGYDARHAGTLRYQATG
jgi:molybdate-binding protein